MLFNRKTHVGQKKNYCTYYAFDVFAKFPKFSLLHLMLSAFSRHNYETSHEQFCG